MISTVALLLAAAVALLVGVTHVIDKNYCWGFLWLLVACFSVFGATR